MRPAKATHPLCHFLAIPIIRDARKPDAACPIAMTAAEAGVHDGRLIEITSEAKLDTMSLNWASGSPSAEST